MPSLSPEPVSSQKFRPCPVDGFAMLSVLLIMVLLSITTVPLMQMVGQNKKRALEQQIATRLNQEAKENLQIGIYLIKQTNGIPQDDYSANSPAMPAEIATIGQQCTKRIVAVDNEFLGAVDLGSQTDPVWHSALTTTAQRKVVVFITASGASLSYMKYIAVACATAANGSLGVYGAELIGVDGGFYTISHGRF